MSASDCAAFVALPRGIDSQDEPLDTKGTAADGRQSSRVAQAVPVSRDHHKAEETSLNERFTGDARIQMASPDTTATDARQFGTPSTRPPVRLEPPAQPPWQFSPALGGHYFYDAQRDLITLMNGTTYPRPQHISSASFGGPASQPRTVSTHISKLGVLPPGGSQRINVPSYNLAPINVPSYNLPPITNVPLIERAIVTRPGFSTIPSSPSPTTLLPGFKVRNRKFFAVGRVFLVLWSEPSVGSDKGTQHSGMVVNHFGERVFSKIRRFVVIREGNNSCTALPINTYSGRGVSKPGIKKSEHVIVYTGRTPPQPTEAEVPRKINEQGMQRVPIRIDPDRMEESLDTTARIDLAAVRTVHHNIKVKSFGIVNSGSMADLRRQFLAVWMKESQDATPVSRPESEVLDGKHHGLMDTSVGNDQVKVDVKDVDNDEDDDEDEDEDEDDDEDDDEDEEED